MGFKVVTYNVLATAYIKPEWYKWVPERLLQPERRVLAQVEHVAGLDADLICLQEVEAEVFAVLDRRLGPAGYAGQYAQKGQGKPDGCATFFRTGLFTLREARRLEYHDQEHGPDGDSGFVALLLSLETVNFGHLCLGVANTHLRWDKPGTARDEQVGYRQIAELMGECEKLDSECDGWLICGDLNRTPDGEVVDFLRQAGFQFAHRDRPDARSCVANRKARLIDYIFFSEPLLADPIDPLAVTDDTVLPSEQQPSDHLPLMAEVGWDLDVVMPGAWEQLEQIRKIGNRIDALIAESDARRKPRLEKIARLEEELACLRRTDDGGGS